MPLAAKTRTALASLLACALVGCAEEPPAPVEPVRSVKTITVAEPASGRVRRFSGVVEAADSSSISFEVAGVVETIAVDVGARVTAGQVLATVDSSAYELAVEAARAAVGRAQADYQDARNNFERLERIAREDFGATSQRALDQAGATRDSARQGLRYATSRLSLAERDLARTALLAPFDAVIAVRHVDAFQQVGRGQKIFDLFMEGAMEAAIRVPESEIDQVYLGLPAEVGFPGGAAEPVPGIVTEVSEVAGEANAFPVRIALDAESGHVRPGQTAEVTLLLGDDGDVRAYLIPIEALTSRDGGGSAVFRFDAESSTVRATPVQYSGLRGSNAVIEEGLGAGDVVVVAGVSFLRDGQKVRLMR